MKAVLCALLLFASGYSIANTRITSCLDSYLAENKTASFMLVSREQRPVGSVEIDHQLDGGLFSLDNSILAVYGLPLNANVDHPQAMRLTIYSLKNGLHAIFKETYGSGVVAIAFSADGKYLIASTRLGQSLIDITERKSKSFDAAHEFKIVLQECKMNKQSEHPFLDGDDVGRDCHFTGGRTTSCAAPSPAKAAQHCVGPHWLAHAD